MSPIPEEVVFSHLFGRVVVVDLMALTPELTEEASAKTEAPPLLFPAYEPLPRPRVEDLPPRLTPQEFDRRRLGLMGGQVFLVE